MTAVEDAQDVVPVRRAVKFTPATPLVEGDIVRFEVTGAVRVVRSNPPEITVGFADVGINRAVTLGLHGAIVTSTLHRLLPPLPAEPDPGAEVLGGSSEWVWRHVECSNKAEDCPAGCPGHWWACAGQVGRYTWAEVLEREGAVRLLGDPIEAPR